jgi:hypothetical protein
LARRALQARPNAGPGLTAAARLYGIPITFAASSSRKHMWGVAPTYANIELRALRTSGFTDAGRDEQRSKAMMDVIMLALGLGFMALTIGYAYACELL